VNIKRLEIKNVLGIQELELNPGQVNIISGGNEKGKTSLLEAIEKAVRNTERRSRFVRDGTDEAMLYVELDDGTTIDRRIPADGPSRVMVTRAGARITKPETALRALVGQDGDLVFNPVDFLAKKDKEQTEILLSLIPMRITERDLLEWFGEVPPVNLNQHAIDVLAYLAEKHFYDRRAIANSAVRDCNNEIAALFEQLPDNYDGNQWRNVNIGELWKEVQKAQQLNGYRAEGKRLIDNMDRGTQAVKDRYAVEVSEAKEFAQFRRQKVLDGVEGEKQAIRNEIADMEEQIRQLQQRIALRQKDLSAVDEKTALKAEAAEKELAQQVKDILLRQETEIENLRTRVDKAAAYLEHFPEADVDKLQAQAEEAERMKAFVPLFDNMKRLETELKDKTVLATRLDDCVAIARQKPAVLLQTIQLPVAGLGIDEKMQVTVDGLPIRNLSTSRQIKLALDIARATAGQLKLVCVDRWESLDEEQRELFLKEIDGDGFQYFISQVTSGDLKITDERGIA
jgi:predicted ATP-binding protein involved in virulence